MATVLANLASPLLPEAWLPTYLLITCALWVAVLILVLALGARYARRLAAESPDPAPGV